MKNVLFVLGVFAFAAIGCESPREPDDSAEFRAGIDAPEGRRTRQRPPQPDPRALLPPMPGPRTNTPGGVAAGLH